MTEPKKKLSELLSSVNTTEGNKRLNQYLAVRPFPHYEPADIPGMLVRVESDGTRTIGRFVGREFIAA